MGHGDNAWLERTFRTGHRFCQAGKNRGHDGDGGDSEPFDVELVNYQPGGAPASVALGANYQIGF